MTMNPENEDSTTPPATDSGFRARHLPGTPAGESKGMLPGMAMVAMYLLLQAMLAGFAAINGKVGVGPGRYGLLAVSTLAAIGAFGMLKLRRWGWSLCNAGFLLMAMASFYLFHKTHAGGVLVYGLFALVFFLYLSRTEVRERLK